MRIELLYQRVSDGLLDIEAQQTKHIERAILSLASIFDFIFVGFIFQKFNKQLVQKMRIITVLGAVIFSFWQVIQAGLNLQNRKNTLEGIQEELRKQIKAKRLFDGREL